MRIAWNGTHEAATLDGVIDGSRRAARDGFTGYWLGQAFGADALTALAVAARQAPQIELGVAVVPIWTRSPQALAAQALTTQAATGGRLTLGIGLSHRQVVEDMWGQRYTRPARRARDYLAALRPLLAGHEVEVRTDTLDFAGRVIFDPKVPPPSVLLGALGSSMLAVAGECTDGTVIGSAGPGAIAEHIVPGICAAAAAARRPAPRVVANVAAVVTDDRDGTRRRLVDRLRAYGELPSFRKMLDREGVESQADIALVGDESTVEGMVASYRAAGVTDLVIAELSDTNEESERTRSCFARLARNVADEEAR